MVKKIHKRVGVVLHDIFMAGIGLTVIGSVVLTYVATTVRDGRGAVAPVVVRPKVDSPVLPKIQPASAGMAFGDTLRTLSQQDLDAQLQDIASLGFTWLRADIDWSAVQPTDAKTYDWKAYDRVIDSANTHHLSVLATIAYAPKWARQGVCASSDKCAPASNDTYAGFAKAAVARYAPKGVKTWEVWNEPNIKGFWQPLPNPQLYTAMLKKAYVAIKGVDPNATVLSAGLSPAEDQTPNIAPRTFLSGMYAAGVSGSFDALGYHPYSYPAPPDVAYSWSAWSQMADLDKSIRSIMVANGDGQKSIWITEVGAPTGGPGATATPANFRFNLSASHSNEQLQAIVVQQALHAVNGFAWTGPMFWYSYKDLGTDGSDNGDFFGIIRADGSKKPAYDVFKRLLAK